MRDALTAGPQQAAMAVPTTVATAAANAARSVGVTSSLRIDRLEVDPFYVDAALGPCGLRVEVNAFACSAAAGEAAQWTQIGQCVGVDVRWLGEDVIGEDGHDWAFLPMVPLKDGLDHDGAAIIPSKHELRLFTKGLWRTDTKIDRSGLRASRRGAFNREAIAAGDRCYGPLIENAAPAVLRGERVTALDESSAPACATS